MRLTIDNHDGLGARDYTGWLAATPAAAIERKMNQPARMKFSLVGAGAGWVRPVAGARVVLTRGGGASVFSGYLATAPQAVLAGAGESGAVYRWDALATSDELLLDRRTIAVREPYVGRTAGAILGQITEALLPGAFTMATGADPVTLPSYATAPDKTWSEHAAELALLARSVYRAQDGVVHFGLAGANEHLLDEQDARLDPRALAVWPAAVLPGRQSGVERPGPMNDVSVIGASEPGAYVKEYRVGDGTALSFALSATPFPQYTTTWMSDEYGGAALDQRHWQVAGNAGAVAVSGGRLQVMGSGAVVQFAEQIELGGALALQHGRLEFGGASSGLVGALCSGGADLAHTVVGFAVTPGSGLAQIQAVVNGAAIGAAVNAVAGWQYVLTTRIYAGEASRRAESFCSSSASFGHGGGTNAAIGHVVLEVHAINPANAGTQVARSQILFDGQLALPAACTYVLVNAASMACTVAYTAFTAMTSVDVQTSYPGAAARTRLVGPLSDGGECGVSGAGYLYFFGAYVPASGESIRASYRATATARARVRDGASAAALAGAGDDGVRAGLRKVKLPAPRTSAECEWAALALLDDATQAAWAGTVELWGDGLPGGAADIFPGDGLHVLASGRGVDFRAVVREVAIELEDAGADRARYRIVFANDAAALLGIECEGAPESERQAMARLELTPVATTAVGATTIADLPGAEMTALTSTTVTVDAGCDPPVGGGIEVRRSDTGWGAGSDRNLAGRFSTRSFTLPRLAKVQSYYLRQYDGSGRYSRYTTELHADYPL